jgi:hypothetical protein
MNVAFICDPEQLCNKFIALEIARHHNLVGLLHPLSPNDRKKSRLRRAREKVKSRGLPHFILEQASKRIGWDETRAFANAQAKFFPNYNGAALSTPVHRITDINGPEGIDLIKSMNVDAVMCHGGPIYREALMRSVPLMLNFHTGISPLYNGASTILFAFANGHPHLCGGTLMTMNPAVDGGDILAHVLPSIEKDDDPATLFFKSTIGAANLFRRALSHVEKTGKYTALPQSPPLFYFRSSDWTVYQSLRISSLLKKGIPGRYLRAEEQIEYYCQPTKEAARHLFVSKILGLLGLNRDENSG